jgi:hypothetical protein
MKLLTWANPAEHPRARRVCKRRVERRIGGSSLLPLKAARDRAAAHHTQRVALVGRGPAAQVVVYFLIFAILSFSVSILF